MLEVKPRLLLLLLLVFTFPHSSRSDGPPSLDELERKCQTLRAELEAVERLKTSVRHEDSARCGREEHASIFEGHEYYPVMPYRERGYFVRDFTGGETSTTMLLRVRRWIGQMFPVLQGKMDIGRYNEMRPAMYERLLQSVDRVQGFDGLRNIHVGIDIGAAVGTPIRSFFDGRVYKFGFNPSPGDYGHVIVTEHNINGHRVWALYGHLSAKSMSRLYE
ncbi:hypothetical protein GUITHDRAFT_165832, partial [Guillardia theta CCMP2712]